MECFKKIVIKNITYFPGRNVPGPWIHPCNHHLLLPLQHFQVLRAEDCLPGAGGEHHQPDGPELCWPRGAVHGYEEGSSLYNNIHRLQYFLHGLVVVVSRLTQQSKSVLQHHNINHNNKPVLVLSSQYISLLKQQKDSHFFTSQLILSSNAIERSKQKPVNQNILALKTIFVPFPATDPLVFKALINIPAS